MGPGGAGVDRAQRKRGLQQKSRILRFRYKDISLYTKTVKTDKVVGVAAYVTTGISVIERERTLALEYESMWIKLKKVNSHYLEFLAVYRPPNILSAAAESHFGLAKEAAVHQWVLNAGDFNAPSIDWENLTVEGHQLPSVLSY
ncbi:unnamed protein product [Dibothriocephalus latus]|uniref:Endonuclease/exonuclease/phosphatase domain-containing protein n=1 Tax=Dibothriocephalus latus TaxID=60516 RepID=A0A3P6QWF6_DIBLA|nr:unnamed protein product [Dibothriocephalus latus]